MGGKIYSCSDKHFDSTFRLCYKHAPCELGGGVKSFRSKKGRQEYKKRRTVPDKRPEKMSFISFATIVIALFTFQSAAAPTPYLEGEILAAIHSVEGPLGLATVVGVPLGVGGLTAQSMANVKHRIPQITVA